jgi:hypothetical protein
MVSGYSVPAHRPRRAGRKIVLQEEMSMASRQYNWQQKQIAKHRCIICGKPSISRVHCQKHLLVQRLRERKRKGYKAWVKGAPGAVPIEYR